MKHWVTSLHPVLSVTGLVMLAGLWWSIWVLVTGPLAHLVHSPLQTFFATLAITLVCASLVTGTLVGQWDGLKQESAKHRHLRLPTVLHPH